MSNISSLASMDDDYKEIIVTRKDKSMLVCLPHKITRLRQMTNRLCGLSLNDPNRHITKEEH